MGKLGAESVPSHLPEYMAVKVKCSLQRLVKVKSRTISTEVHRSAPLAHCTWMAFRTFVTAGNVADLVAKAASEEISVYRATSKAYQSISRRSTVNIPSKQIEGEMGM